MRSSNPVLTRLTPETQAGYRQQPAPYGQPAGYGQGVGYPDQGVITAGTTDRMTVDDVVVRTVALLTVTGLSAALAWAIVPLEYTMTAWITAAIVGLVLGLIIAFKQVTNPAVLFTYAVVEGVFVGMVSKTFEAAFDGIVVQAALGTFGVFFLMAFLYRAKIIRATPRFRKMVLGALIGVFAAMAVNLVFGLFGVNLGLRGDSGGGANWLAIGFSLVCIVVAALTFVLDFDQIEQAVAAGMPKRYAWICAFGILVGLIWLYLEILRLLSYLRGED